MARYARTVRTDIVVVGGGIIGCAAAAMLATRGARVTLVEGVAIGAGASGRNLGAIQHPFDPELAPLYRESLTRYRALVDATGEFSIGAAPAGLLLLNRSEEAAAEQVRRQRESVPELDARLLGPDELARVEPSIAPGFSAVRLETGFPVPPASATAAWARMAVERGVVIEIGRAARPIVESGGAAGVELADGTRIAADAVLVAAGPWTPKLVDPSGGWSPIHPTWGVTVQLRLDGEAPRHIVEEDEVDAINRSDAATARAAATIGEEPPTLFSLASAGGISTLGSTFFPYEPDPAATVALLLRRGTEFLPAVDGAEVVERRMCARPQSVDGRPFIGRAPGVDGLYVCAGHGPWGISTGPASAAIAARVILDGTAPPAALDAQRPFSAPA